MRTLKSFYQQVRHWNAHLDLSKFRKACACRFVTASLFNFAIR